LEASVSVGFTRIINVLQGWCYLVSRNEEENFIVIKGYNIMKLHIRLYIQYPFKWLYKFKGKYERCEFKQLYYLYFLSTHFIS